MREGGFFYLKASGNQSGTSHNCHKPCNVRAYNTVSYGGFFHEVRFLEHLQWCSACDPVQMKSQNMPVSLRKMVLGQHNWTVCGGWYLAAMVYTRTKEFNKYDPDAALCSLPYHNDWSRWFAISSPHPLAVPVSVLWVGLQKST